MSKYYSFWKMYYNMTGNQTKLQQALNATLITFDEYNEILAGA